MVRYSKTKRISLAVTMALMPWMANAASLGNMTVLSGLGEPLRAEIEIAADKSELSSLSARIAPAETYAEQGMTRPAVIGNIRVELVSRQNAPPVLRLSTLGPVNEPYLNMLLQVDWPTGRLLREYTTLLDPPGYGNRLAAAPSASADTSPLPSVPAPSKKNTSDSVAAPEKPKAQAAPAAESPPKEAQEPATYRVQRGDTLHSIARRMQPEDISLEQMLVGLYRNNRDAFSGDNMNRLIAGKIIRTPNREHLQAVPQQDAVQEIRVHTANWNAYRDALAGVVEASEPAAEEPALQESGGAITSPAEDKAAPVSEGPRDVVKLSKAELPSEAGGAAAAGGTADPKLQTLQEDSVAQDKAIDEVTERIHLLEKQIQDMQQLLVVQNQLLSDLQKSQQEPAAQTPATEPVAQTPAPEGKPQPVPAAEPTAASALDNLYENPMLLGGAGALLLLLGGAWLYSRSRRKKGLDSFEQGILTGGGLNKSDTVFAATGASAETSGTTLLGGLSHQGAGGAIDASDVDPISEAEVYMAYGRDAQAEEILKDAITKEPARYELHQKLLEIYAARKDTASFETLAGELYTTLGADDPHWLKVAGMGRELEPGNPMYGGTAGSETSQPADESLSAAEDASDLAVAATSETQETEDRDDNSLDFDLGDLTGEQPEAEAPLADEAQQVEPSGMAMDSVAGDVEVPEAVVSTADETLELPEPVMDESLQLDAADLGLTLEGMDSEEANPVAAVTEEPEIVAAEPEAELTLPTPAETEPDVAPAEPEGGAAADDEMPEISFDLPELDMLEAQLAAEAASEAEAAPETATEAVPLPDEVTAEEVASADRDALEPWHAELPEEAVAPIPEVPDVEMEPEPALGLEVAEPSMQVDEAGEVEEIVIEEPAATEEPEHGGLDFNFELDADEEKGEAPAIETKAQSVPDLDLASISLDLDETRTAGTEELAAEESADVDTKLDLVTAYMDMGDMEGARELLDEVMNEGGPKQRERAKRLLDSMA